MGTRKKPSTEKSRTHREERVRKILTDMRQRLLNEISARIAPDSPATIPENGDLADQAGDERERELSLLLTDREQGKLRAVDEALEKLKKGTYGLCEDCGNPITPQRLKAIPLAKLCFSCQTEEEKEMSIQKEEEEELAYPDPELVREAWGERDEK